MRRFGVPFYAALLCATTCALTLFLFAAPARAEDKSPAMVQYEALSKDFVKLRDVDAKRLGPQQLLEAAESLEGKVQKLVDASAGDPSAKSKALDLLAMTYTFDGKAPEAKKAYSDFLDVLEGWQGKDYAVMAVRRAGDRMLQQEKNPVKAIQYYDLLMEKYRDHQSKAHALYNSGLACLEMKDCKEAVKRFDKVVAGAPESGLAPWALRKKAYALAEMEPAEGNFAQPLLVLDDLAARYPTPHWKAYVSYRKGVIMAKQRKYLEAIAEYSKGVNEYPSSPYSEMGQRQIGYLRKVLESELLDQLAKDKQAVPQPPATAEVKLSGPISMVLPPDDDRLGEGQQ